MQNRREPQVERGREINPPQPPQKQTDMIALAGEGMTVGTEDGQLAGRIKQRIEAQQTHHVRFVFAWYAPFWRDSGHEAHIHQYSTRYTSAQAVASDALARFDSLLSRILGWQQVIYTADLPDWLRDGLIQSLYSLAKNTVWIAKTRKDEGWNSTGWFTHSESHI